jgi:hypothetical protein
MRDMPTRRRYGHCIGDAAAESTSEYSRSRLVPSALRRLYRMLRRLTLELDFRDEKNE